MRIAIVAPSPVPLAFGGAERLHSGLLQAIKELTHHEAELIKLPTREHTLPDLVQSYEAFHRLDLSHFDRVITGKYPAWMIRHPNHVVYMLHRLRGLYDTYEATGLPDRVDCGAPDLRALQELMGRGADAGLLPEFFERFRAVAQDRSLDDPALSFPGPFAREIAHFLDGVALGPHRVQRYCAISNTVARRRDYFPAGVSVRVAYPPSDLRRIRCGRFRYFFTASRLDGPKRIDLLIEAVRRLRSSPPLKIAGTGPAFGELRALADGDNRIEFLGHVTDDELVDLYADALAVPFVPSDEDFGLITLEAMMAGKPVITCSDSGGPTELIDHGLNGYIAAPDPSDLAARLDSLVSDPEKARRLGAAGTLRARSITWGNVIDALIDPPRLQARSRHGGRPRLAVLTTFRVDPPRGGGQLRCLNLYGALAEQFEVEFVSLTSHLDEGSRREIRPGVIETAVPKSPEHQRQEDVVMRAVGGVAVTDILASVLITRTPAYLEALQRAAYGASGVILAHPFLYPALEAAAVDLPFVYDAQDAEFQLKRQVLDVQAAGSLLDTVWWVERAATRNAAMVSVCSGEDGDALASEYGVDRASLLLIPNGVATSGVEFVSLDERSRRSEHWRQGFAALKNQSVARATALFLASWHPPNIDAAEVIFDLSGQLPDVLFLLVGTHAEYFHDRPVPANVALLGMVSDHVKGTLLGTVDVALNPMRLGSGTNLKLVEYLAAGVPVVSTPFGARGLIPEAAEYLTVGAVEDFPRMIRDVVARQDGAGLGLACARDIVCEHYDWRVLGQRFRIAVCEALALPVSRIQAERTATSSA